MRRKIRRVVFRLTFYFLIGLIIFLLSIIGSVVLYSYAFGNLPLPYPLNRLVAITSPINDLLVISSISLVLVTAYSVRSNLEENHKNRMINELYKRLDEFYTPLIGYFSSDPERYATEIKDLLLTKFYLRNRSQGNPLTEGGRIDVSITPDKSKWSATYFDPPEGKEQWNDFPRSLWSEYEPILQILATYQDRDYNTHETPDFKEIKSKPYSSIEKK